MPKKLIKKVDYQAEILKELQKISSTLEIFLTNSMSKETEEKPVQNGKYPEHIPYTFS